MPPIPRRLLLLLPLAGSFSFGCERGSRPEAAAPDSATSPAAAEAPVAVSPDTPVATDSTVVVRYEHTGTCARFLGREGQYFAYRITSVRNNGTTPFTLQPARFRFDGVAPAFMVPEFSELEVAPGAGQDAEEIFLVQRTGTGPPPRGPVPLGYDTAGVVMARGAADPEYDEEGTGCDGFNT